MGGFRHPSALLTVAVALAIIAGLLLLVGLPRIAAVAVGVAALCFVADIVMGLRRR